MQNHRHPDGGNGGYAVAGGTLYANMRTASSTGLIMTAYDGARAGDTTRTKQKGVTYIVKVL